MIKFVVFDFDGVFTDGKCFFDEIKIIKSYDVKDGKAIGLLRDNNIMVGLLSAYRTELGREILINGVRIEEAISTHLKFDKVSIGNGNKLTVLDNWLKELNYQYEEVAYIGDDLADVDILKAVGLSACPGDAITECMEVADYICDKRGGEGCVREFVEYILANKVSSLSRGAAILREIKKEVNYQLDTMDVVRVEEVANIIRQCHGNIYFTGIGKSKNISTECCILLKSIGIGAFSLDAVEALHGDIGSVMSDDLVIMFSKSGNTMELIELCDILQNKHCETIGICCDSSSKFKNVCNYCVELPFRKEIGGEINNIPTNSYMSQMIFSNLLVSLLKEDITIDDYKLNHLGGTIGKHLQSLKKYFKTVFPKFCLDSEKGESMPLYDIIMEMTRLKMGCAFFVDSDDRLLGILTDGDIRRMYITQISEIITIDVINREYYYENDINKLVRDCRNPSFIPIIDDDKKLLGVCDMVN